MASPPFVVEDDEDFFDKLVDDEVDDHGIGVQSGSKNLEINDVNALARLNIDDIGSPVDGVDSVRSFKGGGEKSDNISHKFVGEENERKEDGSGIVESPELVDPKTSDGSGIVKESSKLVDPKTSDGSSIVESPELVGPISVTAFSDHVASEETRFNSVTLSSGANVDTGIKQVQWSAFSGGTGEGSYSDFFGEFGDDSADPFAEVAGGSVIGPNPAVGVSTNQANCESSYSFLQNVENQQHVSSNLQTEDTQEESSSQYWENLYPGWTYDPNTGQWYQLDSFHGILNNVESDNASPQSTSEEATVDPKSDTYYLQQTSPSIAGSVAEGTTGTLSYWNQPTQVNTEYPALMVFYPQYPGWYYDTIAQEWKSLESYTSLTDQSAHNQHRPNGGFTSGSYYEQNMTYGGQGEVVNSYPDQQDQLVNWKDSGNNQRQQDTNMVQSEAFGRSEAVSVSSPRNTQFGNRYMPGAPLNYPADHRGVAASENLRLYEPTSQGFDSTNELKGFQGFNNGVVGFQNFAPSGQLLQPNNQHNMEFDQRNSAAYYNGPGALNFSQQPLQNSRQLSYASNEGRSSAGRLLMVLLHLDSVENS